MTWKHAGRDLDQIDEDSLSTSWMLHVAVAMRSPHSVFFFKDHSFLLKGHTSDDNNGIFYIIRLWRVDLSIHSILIKHLLCIRHIQSPYRYAECIVILRELLIHW